MATPLGRPASSEYRVRLIRTTSDWRDRVFGGALGALVVVAVAIFGWGGDVPDKPGRFRVVVGRRGADEGVGVATAFWRRDAGRALRAVQSDLADLSPAEFAVKYGLDAD